MGYKSKEYNESILLTVFTPAFNRAHTLIRTYKSLQAQTCKDFIWLVVDDGSTDNTAELICSWKKENNNFEIQYIYKKNGGMHTAHNTSYENIYTELNVCIDSDDYMPEDAVELILEKWSKIKNKGYAGIVGLDADSCTGKVIGKDFQKGLQEITLSGYYAAGGRGDKKQVYRTDIINKYPPYPTFEGEKYFSLSYKYLLIDQDYKLAVLNKILCYVEYQQDGSSNNMLRQYYVNPKGFAEWRKIRMRYDLSYKRCIMDCIHYCSSSILCGNKNYISQSPYKKLALLCSPAGWLLANYIKISNKRDTL